MAHHVRDVSDYMCFGVDAKISNRDVFFQSSPKQTASYSPNIYIYVY